MSESTAIELEPELQQIISSIITGRWLRCVRLFKDRWDDFRDVSRAISYPLLRPQDIEYLMSWDGMNYAHGSIPRIALRLVGQDIRAQELTISHYECETPDGIKESLLVHAPGVYFPTPAGLWSRQEDMFNSTTHLSFPLT